MKVSKTNVLVAAFVLQLIHDGVVVATEIPSTGGSNSNLRQRRRIAATTGQSFTYQPSCQLDVDICSCTVIVDQNGGFPRYTNQPCSSFQFNGLHLENCLATPYSVELLYNGGDCSQSTNLETLGFTCTDDNGGPPTLQGNYSYIEVVNPQNPTEYYHRGYVAVGSSYHVSVAQDMILEDGFQINIYDGQDPTVPLQRILYEQPLCDSNMEMFNVFGASQIISYHNALQGYVTPFASINFGLEVELCVGRKAPSAAAAAQQQGASAPSPDIKMASLRAVTDFAGDLDLTNVVVGNIIQDQDVMNVRLEALPMGAGGDHKLLVTATATEEDESRRICSTTQLIDFNVDISSVI